MAVQIFTSVVNRPDFVEIQKKLFDKFLKNDYEFHVVDDSIDENVSKEFQNICQSNSIKYHKKDTKDSNLNPAQACASAIQWTYDNLILKNHSEDKILFLDSDMFLIDNFDIEKYLDDCFISGLPQIRGNVKYLWNGIMLFDMKKIFEIDPYISFSDGVVEGHLTDVGGETYFYFKKNNISFKETDVQYPTHFEDIELQNENLTKGYNFELHLNGKFLHYRAATNWHSNWRGVEDPLLQKTKIFNKIIEKILSQ